MSTFQIEKGVPLPGPHARSSRFPLRHMSPGDSFYVPAKAANSALVQQYAAKFKMRNPGYAFCTRRDSKGVRVWCTATPAKKDTK